MPKDAAYHLAEQKFQEAMQSRDPLSFSPKSDDLTTGYAFIVFIVVFGGDAEGRGGRRKPCQKTNPASKQKRKSQKRSVRVKYWLLTGKEFLMTISEIERAIKELSPKELSRFHAWFEEYFAQVWDKQIEQDAKSGRLDKIIAEVEEEYNAGLSKPL